jgi:hypothetical protein
MNGSEASLLAIIFGLGVFAVIVAVGWRSVQHRRIMRLQDASGKETIIVANEDDEISSVVSTTEAAQPEPAPAPSVVVVNTGIADPAQPAESGSNVPTSDAAMDVAADRSGRERLNRMVSSTK